jgi:YVTN family beta-propeller protein
LATAVTEFRILGLLEVRENGQPVDVGGGKQRALLAVLLLAAGETVSTDRLIDALWGESPPASGPNSLHAYVSRLRRALGSDRLVRKRHGYQLVLEPDELDLDRFRRLLASGRELLRAGDAEQAADALAAALALWHGPPLSDFTYEPFAAAAIADLEELRLTALEERIEADLACGRHREVVPQLEVLVRGHPLRERLRAQLMLALYRSGRQAEALETFREGRATLVGELGLEPGPALQELERQILRHDNSLEDRSRSADRRGFAFAPVRVVLFAAALVAAGAVLAAIQLTQGGSSPLIPPPNSVAVIDPEKNRVAATIPVGERPVSVAFGYGSVWVANADDGTVSRIDAHKRVVVHTTGIGAPVADIATGAGSVWVAGGGEGTLFRLDPRSSAVVDRLDLSGPDELAPRPTYAVAVGYGSVWVATGRTVLRIDAETGQRVATIDVPDQVATMAAGEHALWIAPIGGRVLRVEPRTNKVGARIAAARGPISIVAGEGAVWLGEGFGNRLWRIDPATSTVTGTVAVGRDPGGIAIGAGSVWTSNLRSGTVSRIDPDADRVVASIPVKQPATDVAFGGGSVWVSVVKPDAIST